MKISGIIAEYNPFHNGHQYQIAETKKKSDAVVCVMSGSFVQRGDVAIFDKWTRTKAALQNGADLVIELPVVFAASTAERFAFGAVRLISLLGVVDELCFGSESGDIQKLTDAARHLCHESELISEKIKYYLSEGKSFPAARQEAYTGIIDSEILNNPNNILGVEYIKALLTQKSHVKPVTLQRCGDHYHNTLPQSRYASATALRKILSNQSVISGFVPKNIEQLYKANSLYSLSMLSQTIIYLLRATPPKVIAKMNDVSEGLEYRLIENAMTSNSMEELIEKTVTKRYTRTKIQRILVSILLGIDKTIVRKDPEYIRILGFNNTGRAIINKIKNNSSLPIITKTADFKEPSQMFKKDILATDVAALCCTDPSKRKSGMDYTTPPIYI